VARLISYILFLLFAVTTFGKRSSAATIFHDYKYTQYFYKKQVFHAAVGKENIEKFKEKAKFKKKKHIKTRYMKAEIRFILSSVSEFQKPSYYTSRKDEFLYIACYSSDHHKLRKLRGPPHVIS
jgi:hypothetical protein